MAVVGGDAWGSLTACRLHMRGDFLGVASTSSAVPGAAQAAPTSGQQSRQEGAMILHSRLAESGARRVGCSCARRRNEREKKAQTRWMRGWCEAGGGCGGAVGRACYGGRGAAAETARGPVCDSSCAIAVDGRRWLQAESPADSKPTVRAESAAEDWMEQRRSALALS